MLTLRGTLTAATRVRYARTLDGQAGSAASTREDAWQRATELLFEHLAVRWVIAGAPIERQRELLARFRAASPAERAWVREALREHCAEHFPDVSSALAERRTARRFEASVTNLSHARRAIRSNREDEREDGGRTC